jgi:ribosome-binding factor A
MAGAPSSRQQRVGDLLRAEISEIVRTKMRDPRVGFLTVTDVSVSRDLRHASVFVSVLGEESEGLAVLGVLNRAAGFVRCELGTRVDLRHVPELRFKMDNSAQHAVRIAKVLKDILDTESEEDA